jgi:hypothetical protein
MRSFSVEISRLAMTPTGQHLQQATRIPTPDLQGKENVTGNNNGHSAALDDDGNVVRKLSPLVTPFRKASRPRIPRRSSYYDRDILRGEKGEEEGSDSGSEGGALLGAK